MNSTKKHFKDKDKTQLQKKIDQTLRMLHKIAKELDEDGYIRAGEFIIKNASFMVTFAELALEDIKIPYTTNRIERLMGEVSKRCKHKWMHVRAFLAERKLIIGESNPSEQGVYLYVYQGPSLWNACRSI